MCTFCGRCGPGRITGQGRVVQRTGDVAALEASLLTADETLIATATARVIDVESASTAV